MTLARAEHRAAEGEMNPMLLTACARRVALELAPQAVRKQIDLSLDAEQEADVRGNPLLLHELISNLVDNAIRYTPPGGQVALRETRDLSATAATATTAPVSASRSCATSHCCTAPSWRWRTAPAGSD